jgi:hypothetical protein
MVRTPCICTGTANSAGILRLRAYDRATENILEALRSGGQS